MTIAFTGLFRFATGEQGLAGFEEASLSDLIALVIDGELAVLDEDNEKMDEATFARRLIEESEGATRIALAHDFDGLVTERLSHHSDGVAEAALCACLRIAEARVLGGDVALLAANISRSVLSTEAASREVRAAAFMALAALDRGAISRAGEWITFAKGIEAIVAPTLIWRLLRWHPQEASGALASLVASPDQEVRASIGQALQIMELQVHAALGAAEYKRLVAGVPSLAVDAGAQVFFTRALAGVRRAWERLRVAALAPQHASARPTLKTSSEFFGHPRALAYLVGAQTLERMAYFGTLSLLVLYLSRALMPAQIDQIGGLAQFRGALELLYGPLMTPVALAVAITGVYASGVYLMPIIGDAFANRIGRKAAAAVGALLLLVGYILLAADIGFVAALACLLMGVGLFKGNIASQVGELYDPGDVRRSKAFRFCLLGVQIAVVAAPLIIGTLGAVMDWRFGFGASAATMAAALVLYLWGVWRHSDAEPRLTISTAPASPPLGHRDWVVLAVLVALLPVLAITALGNQQIFNGYLLWGEAHYDLAFFGRTIPAPWLISLDACLSALTVGASSSFWMMYGRYWREPNEIVKLAAGAVIAASAPLLLAAASATEIATGQPAPLAWGVGFHLINAVGFGLTFPVGLTLFVRAAPKGLVGPYVALYYLHLFVASVATGGLGARLETMDGVSFWLLQSAIVGAGAVVLGVYALLFGPLLASVLSNAEAAEATPIYSSSR